ncbi:MAG: c-type cytochrome [Bryobacteraceae bacterium]|nr:c-type cytochrome [Bryobacteraceae bacterium]
MKKFAIALFALALLAGGGFAWLATKKPAFVQPLDMKVEITDERITRGRYLFENLADCDGCHSPRDWNRFPGPVIEAERASGFEFPAELGLPGRVISANLSSDPETGLGAWTDGEILRALREGVSRDGRALFNFMPFEHYAHMSDEDAYALIAYMRTIPPVRKAQPRTELVFPVKYLINDLPRPVNGPVAAPTKEDRVKYGEYLVTLGECKTCHSLLDKGVPVAGREFAGGEPFRFDTRLVRSANITPDEETGIGLWSEDRFVAKFKGYAEMTAANAPPMNQSNFTIMPWLGLARLTDEDLRAIYAYLRTIPAIRHPVDVHPQQGTY